MTDVKNRIRSGWWYEPTMNMLKGYTQTIDEPTEIEYVKNVGLGTPVFEVDRLLSILLRTAWTPGELINGLPTWRYELTVGPDHWLLLTVESEDGERVARFNAKIMNNND